MKITIAIPERKKYSASDVKSDHARVSLKQDGQYVTISAFSEKNEKSNLEVFF